MSDTGEPDFDVRFHRAARCALAEQLPEAVAAAVIEFCAAGLTRRPIRVDKPLAGPLSGCYGARRGTYRIVYRVDATTRTVDVVDIARRGSVHRPR